MGFLSMPLRTFECKVCGAKLRTKFDKPLHCDVEAVSVLEAPTTKFLERVDFDKNKSQMVDQQKILKERARANSRDVDTIDLIEKNPMDEAIKNKWVKEDGTTRKKIDDL